SKKTALAGIKLAAVGWASEHDESFAVAKDTLRQMVPLSHSSADKVESLSQLQVERSTTTQVVAIVQVEQERARQLLTDRKVAIDTYNASAKHLQECLVEKTLAFRAREGVEEEAKLAMLHAAALERTTANMRLLWDAAHTDRQQVKESIQTLKGQLEGAVDGRHALSDRLLALQYRRKGTKVHTPYGVGVVQYFRESDNILAIRLRTWKATVYISLVHFIQAAKAMQQRELLAMRSVEVECKAFVRVERRREASECHVMETEEALCREITLWAQQMAAKEGHIRVAVTKVEVQTQVRMALRDAKRRFRNEAEADAVRAHAAKIRLVRPKLKTMPKKLAPQRSTSLAKMTAAMAITSTNNATTNSATPAALPKVSKQSTLDKTRVARAALKRILMAHAEAAVLTTERDLVAEYDRVHHDQLVTTVGNGCVASLLHELLVDVADETIQEGVVGAKTMELQSTIVHSRQHPHVQVNVHVALRRQVVGRKMQLEVVKRTWARQLERLRCVQAEVRRRNDMERRAEEERKRLEAVCKEMAREDLACRRFYREEKRVMMVESRHMQLAERELQLMLEKYNTLDGDDKNKEGSKVARRLQIKKGKREKHRLADEWAAIKLEDDLAMAIREVWLQERREQEQEQQQLEFMLQQAEFQESDTESDLEFEDNEDIDDDDGDQHKPVMDAVAARAKERMVHLNPKARAILEQQLERRAKAKLIAAKKRHDFAHRLNEEYMVAAAETMFAVANADLTIVQMQEKLAYFQRLDSDADQIKRMQLDLKRNQQQAKEITDGARRKHEYAAALELAIAREKRDEKVMHKTIKDTAYMDSSVLHKRCQRFLTDYLAKELYKKYFQTLVHLIVLRTFTVSTERHLLSLGERIQSLDRESADKTAQVARLWRKHMRASRMRLWYG
ncbi:hypothetical protein DYB38_004625, partial [Aphanomyces astaci]